jgi:hypothetical protein
MASTRLHIGRRCSRINSLDLRNCRVPCRLHYLCDVALRSKDIVGKRIKRVVQSLTPAEPLRGRYWGIDYIEFDDGTRLTFLVLETNAEYYVAGIFKARDVT